MTRIVLAVALAAAVSGCIPALSLAIDYVPLPETGPAHEPYTGSERPPNCPAYTPLRDCIAPPPA